MGSSSVLAAFYERGKGVPLDYSEAVKWYRLAAEQVDVFGLIGLGNLYEIGKGVPMDYVLAYMWFNLAAAKGGTKPAESRDEVAKLMTPGQIAEAQRLAREWKPTLPK
jgi:TPR repeat protein